MADKIALKDWVGPDDDLSNLDRMRQLRDALTQIKDTEGKKYLDKILRHRYHGIMAGLTAAPLQSLDGALAQEYFKGQAYECLYQENLCENLIASFDEAIEELKLAQMEEYEDGE